MPARMQADFFEYQEGLERDLAPGPYLVVLVTGIEPVRGETSQDFKSWASANSATPADYNYRISLP